MYKLISRQSILREEEIQQEKGREVSSGKEDHGTPVEDVSFGLNLEERPDVHVRWTGLVSTNGKPWDDAWTPESSLATKSFNFESRTGFPCKACVP